MRALVLALMLAACATAPQALPDYRGTPTVPILLLVS